MRTFHTPLTIIETLSKARGDSAAVKYLLPESSTDYKTITYAEFWNDIDNVAKIWASALSSAGIAKGAVVGIWMRGWSYQDLLHYLSLQRAGFIPQLFSLRMTNPSVVYELLNKSQAAALIYDPSCEALVTDCPVPVFPIEGALDKNPLEDTKLTKVTNSLDGDQISVIFHTSGSTSGMPKLVPATVKWMDCLIRKNKPYPDEGPRSIYCFIGSHAHVGNTMNLVRSLANAGCIIAPKSIPYPTSELQSMITHGGLTALNTFPALLSIFFRDARTNATLLEQLQSLNHIWHGGQVVEPSDAAFARQHGLMLIDNYGSTEIGMSMRKYGDSQYLTPFPESSCEFIPMGESASTSDQLFELVIPADADDCPHPSLRNKEDGKFHTGDLFQKVGNNQYLYKGRVDDRIKMQLSLVCDAGSLEAEAMQVCEADLISAVSVIGSGRPSPAIVVEPKNDDILQSGNDTLLDFKQEIVRRLSPFHSRKYVHERIDDPRLVFIVPQGTLPRTAKGNVMRKAVEAMLFDELESIFAFSRKVPLARYQINTFTFSPRTQTSRMSSIVDSVKNTIAENFGGPAEKLATHQFSLSETPDLTNKVAVVTGGSEGIGYGVTHTFLSHNISKLFILSISEEVVAGAKKSVARELGQDKADRTEWIKCDLSDWAEVKKAAEQIKGSTDRLDILANNAGRGIMTYQLSKYGVDQHMAVNYFGHVLLTSYLLELLKKTAEEHGTVRIVNLASNAHQGAPSDVKFESLDELNQDLGPNPQYGRSKLANILYTRYFDRHVTKAGNPKILMNATHPGFVSTRQSVEHIHEAYPLAGYAMSAGLEPFKKDQFQGATSSVYAATVTDKSGQYICPPAVPESGNELSQNERLGDQLMELTRKIISDKFENFDDRKFY
ncbi:4-hydroxybenzoate benzoate ligase [Fusarium beomiforme]|uniref:4-hydroxybenzoate benzoate ligase n=1 Tax=Fusarium beomiforme TaxID=44412 RepID=A0A9P5AGA9_9HYPO|nr:4-hydroxybenzoate benzoate ligase [Fusarium beomiforme]